MPVLFKNGHFFEGARWHDGHWWASDMYAPKVMKITTQGETEIMAEVPGRPAGLGWMPDGTLLIVSMTDRKVLRRMADGELAVHADIFGISSGLANDMVVDPAGRAYVSCTGFNILENERPCRGAIIRVDPDGSACVAAADMDYPNGLVVSDDGSELIVAETFGARLTAFRIGDDGSLEAKRTWAQVGTAPEWDSIDTLVMTNFAPDGCAIDADGMIWVADAINARALKLAPGGDVLGEIKAPDGLGIYACALGGESGRELLMCLAPSFDLTHCLSNRDAVLFVEKLDG